MKQYLKRIYSKSQNEYYKELKRKLTKEEKQFIITVNPESLMNASKDKELDTMLLDKEVSLVPDGIAVVKACQMLKLPVEQRITGVDIAEYLLEEGHKQKKSIYLFGSKQEVLDAMENVIKEKYPNLKIAGMTNGYVEDKDAVFKKIKKAKPDICLVALGIPAQEKLIYKHLDEFDKGIFVGVGGSLDVLSGTKKRAPKLFIKLNLEWLYRIAKEPKRLKRFWDNNVKFIFEVKKEK